MEDPFKFTIAELSEISENIENDYNVKIEETNFPERIIIKYELTKKTKDISQEEESKN